MILFITGLFNSVNFLVQLWAAILLFSPPKEKREHFLLRIVAGCAAALGLGAVSYAALAFSDLWLVYNMAFYLLLFLYGILVVWGAYDLSFLEALDAGTTGYIVQNLVSQISQMILRDVVFSRETLLDSAASRNMMAAIEAPNGVFGRTDISALAGYLLTIPVTIVFYVALYYLFAGRMQRTNYTAKTKRKLLVLSFGTLAVVLLLSSYRDAHASESFALMIASRLLSIMCCLLLLIMKTGILELNTVEQEGEILKRLRAQEREQYEQKKETVDLINIKCHDMRHQIERLERQIRLENNRRAEQYGSTQGALQPQPGSLAKAPVDQPNLIQASKPSGQTTTSPYPPHIDEGQKVFPSSAVADELGEMKQLIRIYDSTVKTGNETLDTILTEQSLVCEKYGIRLSCIADGSKLDFMSVGDICSLFGNALENAIQAVQQLPDPDERIISLHIEQKAGMLLIRVENSYTGTLSFDDGLPKTTKGDNGYHGFGMKSIRLITQKYGGIMKIQTGEEFVLNIMIPTA